MNHHPLGIAALCVNVMHSTHSRMLVVIALCGTALMTCSPAWASDSQLWAGGSATVKLSDKWAISEDVTARFSDERHGLYEIEANTLLGYRLSKNVALWAGYTHDPNYSSGHLTSMERRAREQVTFDRLATLGNGKFSGRLRMEERWRDGFSGTGWRFRPFVRYSLPLHKGGRTALTISEEPFIDFNTTSFQKVSGLERLRTFVGITTPLVRNVSAEVGYMNQHGFIPNGKDTSDNIASISLSLNL